MPVRPISILNGKWRICRKGLSVSDVGYFEASKGAAQNFDSLRTGFVEDSKWQRIERELLDGSQKIFTKK
jgi:hypothetical protein